MSLRVIEDGSMLRQVRDELIAAFRSSGAIPMRIRVGYPGGRKNVEALWSEDLGLWFAWQYIESSRYWNSFGTARPHSGTVPILCEINFPIQGVNRQVSGAVATDGTGQVVLLHRGRIGGGKAGAGRDLFWSNFDGSSDWVADGDRPARMAVVAHLQSPRLLRQIQFFVHEVDRIKDLARSRVIPDELPSRPLIADSGSDEFQFQQLGDEFWGDRRYTLKQRIEAKCDHGLIVKALSENLVSLGYTVGKDRERDLYVRSGEKTTSLFEVKPCADRDSLFRAIGQLLVYRDGMPGQPQPFLVAPDDLDPRPRELLKRLAINVIGFQWRDGIPVFPTIRDWKF